MDGNRICEIVLELASADEAKRDGAYRMLLSEGRTAVPILRAYALFKKIPVERAERLVSEINKEFAKLPLETKVLTLLREMRFAGVTASVDPPAQELSALGNDVVPVLIGVLEGKESELRDTAAWALGKAGAAAAPAARNLVSLLENTSADTCSITSSSLVLIGEPAIPALVEGLDTKNTAKLFWLGTVFNALGKQGMDALDAARSQGGVIAQNANRVKLEIVRIREDSRKAALRMQPHAEDAPARRYRGTGARQ